MGERLSVSLLRLETQSPMVSAKGLREAFGPDLNSSVGDEEQFNSLVSVNLQDKLAK